MKSTRARRPKPLSSSLLPGPLAALDPHPNDVRVIPERQSPPTMPLAQRLVTDKQSIKLFPAFWNCIDPHRSE